jgi:hypothetical protein
MEKFIPPFIDFVNLEFDSAQHFFLGYGHIDQYPCSADNFSFVAKNFFSLVRFIWLMNKADQIILHGMFNKNVNVILLCFWWLRRRSKWVVWGGDLYDCLKRPASWVDRWFLFVQRSVVHGLGGLITYLPGDYQRAREWLGAKAPMYRCNCYLSNIFTGQLKSIPSDRLTLLVGNSADPANCHEEIFCELAKLPGDYQIVCPLSYGNREYGDHIEQLGRNMFGERFLPLRKLMPFAEYMVILDKISIAVFAHKRQQAMGNTISLLGAGKKVVLRSGTAQADLFNELGIYFQEFEKFDLKPLDQDTARRNHNIIADEFSRQRLIEQWSSIFEGRKDG